MGNDTNYGYNMRTKTIGRISSSGVFVEEMSSNQSTLWHELGHVYLNHINHSTTFDDDLRIDEEILAWKYASDHVIIDKPIMWLSLLTYACGDRHLGVIGLIKKVKQYKEVVL